MVKISKLDYAKALNTIKLGLEEQGFEKFELAYLDVLSAKLLTQPRLLERDLVEYTITNVQDLAIALKLERLHSEHSQKDFAEKVGIDKSNYCRIENGKSDISLSQFIKICQELFLEIKLISLPF